MAQVSRVHVVCVTVSLCTLVLFATSFGQGFDEEYTAGLAPVDAAATVLSAPLPAPRPRSQAQQREAGPVQPELVCADDPPGVPDPPPVHYWRRHRGDVHYASEYSSAEKKYVTFEPDCGGWNNVRMSFETAVVFALLTGRILVMPPKDMEIYLLDKNPARQRNSHGIHGMYNMAAIEARLPVIDVNTFVSMEVKAGRLGPAPEGVGDGRFASGKEPCGRVGLYNWLESGQARGVHWIDADVSRTYFVFPKTPGGDPAEDALDDPWVRERMKVMSAHGRRRPLSYTADMQQARVVHFSGHTNENGGTASPHQGRLLTHFYAWVMHADRSVDDFSKRFVRDVLHYHPKIFCKALDVLSLLAAEAQTFSSMHVRRGELQYTDVKLDAGTLLRQTRGHLRDGETVFIATDEANKTFFQPLKSAGYNVRFLSDYREQAGLFGVNQNWLGMIDSIVASHGRTFTGTYMSTFTGYIHRLRMYYGKPAETNWYHTTEVEELMQGTVTDFGGGLLFAREWPLCCVGIDRTTVTPRKHAWAATRVTDADSDAAVEEDRSVGDSGASLTVFTGKGCTGDSLEIPSSFGEDRCANCWDPCGKTIGNGNSAHDEKGSRIVSVRSKGLRVAVHRKQCSGVYTYADEELTGSFMRVVIPAGCVTLPEPLAHAHWSAVSAGVTLYSEGGCQGASLTVPMDFEEQRCSGCFDVCGKTFNGGQPMHTAEGSAVASFRVSPGVKVRTSTTGCLGTYGYDSADTSTAVTAAGGCVETAHLHHVAFEKA